MFNTTCFAAFVALISVTSAAAQTSTKPWQLLLDSASSSSCDVINAANAQLVLLTATSQLSIVTQTDVTLQDTQVDADGFVTFEGNAAGAIGFATDGDGKRTVWWMSLTGTVVNVNGFTGQPTETNRSPADFSNVACDACPFWDDPTVCAPAPPPVPPPPPVTVNLCGTSVQLPIGLTAAGLVALSFTRRRRRW
jgi:hypothetical protein